MKKRRGLTKKQRRRRKLTQAWNRRLLKKYPWLMPRNVWTGKVLDDYKYLYTEYDAIPEGWRKAFGMMMIKEYDDELKKYNAVKNYRIYQIKEKYGMLRWYDSGYVGKMEDINRKYEVLSQNICIRCGNEAPLIDDGWVCPWCYKCFSKGYHYRDKSQDEVHELYHKFIIDEPNEDGKYGMSDTYKLRRYSDGEIKEITVDISDTVNKIRNIQSKWYKNKRNKDGIL